MAAFVGIGRRWRSDRGAELIEFAVAFPLLLLVVLGIVDFGFLFQKYEVVTNAAREGARLAALPDYEGSLEDNVRFRVKQYLGAAGLIPADAVVNVTGPANVDIGGNCMSTYTVTVRYPHGFSFVGGIASYFGRSLSAATLAATSTMRGEMAAGTCSGTPSESE